LQDWLNEFSISSLPNSTRRSDDGVTLEDLIRSPLDIRKPDPRPLPVVERPRPFHLQRREPDLDQVMILTLRII
jgi:hypothetical protein